MRLRTLALPALGLAAGLFAVYATAQTPSTSARATTASTSAAPKTYTVDTLHSSVVFRVKHLGVSYFYGRFNDFGGSFTVDEAQDPSNIKFEVTVKADSVDTGNGGRDGHLRNNDFFNAKQYPEMTFKSTSAKKVKTNMFEVTGDLTVRGTTKSIKAMLEFTGAKNAGPRFGDRAGYEGRFAIKRTDFDMGYGVEQGILGDEVTIMLGLEGTMK